MSLHERRRRRVPEGHDIAQRLVVDEQDRQDPQATEPGAFDGRVVGAFLGLPRRAGPVAERRPADGVVRLPGNAAVDEGADLAVRALVVLRAVGHRVDDAVLVPRAPAVPGAAEQPEARPVHVGVREAVHRAVVPLRARVPTDRPGRALGIDGAARLREEGDLDDVVRGLVLQRVAGVRVAVDLPFRCRAGRRSRCGSTGPGVGEEVFVNAVEEIFAEGRRLHPERTRRRRDQLAVLVLQRVAAVGEPVAIRRHGRLGRHGRHRDHDQGHAQSPTHRHLPHPHPPFGDRPANPSADSINQLPACAPEPAPYHCQGHGRPSSAARRAARSAAPKTTRFRVAT